MTLWDFLTATLPEKYDDSTQYRTDGDTIYCRTAEQANSLADLVDQVMGTSVTTGYFDPAEDEKYNMVDGYTGWHYIDM